MIGVFRALAQVPAVLKLLEAIAFWILSETKAIRLAQLKKNLDIATTLARTEKDTSKLDQLFKGD